MTCIDGPIALPEACRDRIDQLLASGQRRLLGIAAAPGAGKSTLASAIAHHYGEAVRVVPMDGFHLANATLHALGRHTRKGAPDTFDAAGFVALLQRLRTPKPDTVVYAPEFRREIEEPIAGAIAVPADTPLVVTEGNYLLLDEAPWLLVRTLLDEAWYLDVPEALREARLMARHQRYGRSADAARAWIAQTDAPNALRVARCRHRADWCLPWG
ncbi:MAG: nucleoside/nucleotide kinase family protein [Rhodoferax sp.]